MTDSRTSQVVCLAASGGGHLRQIMDLKPLWQDYSAFVVTEDTALGRSIAGQVDTEFVPHFAIGQARLGAPLHMLKQAFRSIGTSFSIIRKRRPDFVISTGAGSQCLIVLWARLMGARIILIDSFARFDSPSKFARLCGPLAHHRLAQSAAVAKKWRGAEGFDPLKAIAAPSVRKENLVFATVGATLPFPRLTSLVAGAKARGDMTEDVLLQTGKGGAITDAAEGLTQVEEMAFDTIKETLLKSRIVICHGGTGSIITALQAGCAAIVIPRSFERGEHYDNHQFEIAQSFRDRGLVFMAHDEASLSEALQNARVSRPVAVTTDYTPMIRRLRELMG